MVAPVLCGANAFVVVVYVLPLSSKTQFCSPRREERSLVMPVVYSFVLKLDLEIFFPGTGFLT